MASDSLKRKLTTILYADVAGYSRLSGNDEEGTHRRVMQMLDCATAKIGDLGGTVLRYAGDAILAEFASVVSAVTTAVEIQQVLAVENSELDEGDRVQIRIGINIGDVIEARCSAMVSILLPVSNPPRPRGVSVFPLRYMNRSSVKSRPNSSTTANRHSRISNGWCAFFTGARSSIVPRLRNSASREIPKNHRSLCSR